MVGGLIHGAHEDVPAAAKVRSLADHESVREYLQEHLRREHQVAHELQHRSRGFDEVRLRGVLRGHHASVCQDHD